MFPTQGKDKIPRTVAYPANAKLVSEALADVPQAEILSVSFAFLSTSAFRKDSQSCSVLYVSYYNWKPDQFTPRYVEENGSCQPRWSISIEPVPVSIKRHVQELLQSEGLPKVHNWLSAKSNVTGTRQVHRLRVSYNQDFDRLEYKEHFHP